MMIKFTTEEINRYFPIEAIVVYPGGMEIKRGCNLPLHWSRRYLRIRGRIEMVSRRSLNRLALLVKSCGVTFLSVMTLTYGQNYPMSGKLAKSHLNAFLVSAKRDFGAFDYVWVVEFQERGAVHFHLAVTLPPPSELDRWRFASIWQRISTPMSWEYCSLDYGQKGFVKGQVELTDKNCITVHMFPRHWEGIRKRDGIGRYFAKYANKLRQKRVPESFQDVGRFWGASRGVKMPEGELIPAVEGQVLEVAMLKGRNLDNWPVIPKVVLF